MAKLLFIDGPIAGREIKLDRHQPLVIGRAKDCDLTIIESPISGHHARFEFGDDGWMVTDLNSSNGTIVNNVPIENALLSEGTVVVLGGGTKIRFTQDDEQLVGTSPVPGTSGQASTSEPQAIPQVPKPNAVSSPQISVPKSVATPVRATHNTMERSAATADDLALVEQMRNNTDAIRREVGKVIIGQVEVIDQVLMVIIAGGHGLLIGMPGMAKTTLVATIARVLTMDFRRIQFTPDLMPSDITGTEVLETNKQTNEKEFRFIRGPIFTNLLLADEINRTPPKTQAALLEAMQEKHVTAGQITYELDKPFFVLATQNPIEQEGTYPLPEAQMDRFMFNIWVNYPKADEEERIIRATTVGQSAKPEKVLDKLQVIQLQEVVRKIPVSDHVIKYAIRLVRATRPGDPEAPDFIRQYVSYGAGPRAGQFLILAAKARAVLEGRIHVSCNDIKKSCVPVLIHRIFPNFAADSEGLKSTDLIAKLLSVVPEPNEDDYPLPR